ncbi:hypothetical protein, partial [Komagataeibacter sp. NFXK3]
RASRSSTSKKPGCFIIHSSTQSPQEVWNHRYALKTMEFLEPSIFRVDDNTILNVRSTPDPDGLDMAIFIGFISTNNGIGADEDIAFDDHMTAQDRGRVDKGAFRNYGEITARIWSQHSHISSP